MTALGTDQLAGLDRVSLEQLNDRAALMHRQENKYLVDAADFSAALGELGEHFDVLDIEGRTAFSYSTVYFDSEALAAYHQHAQGKRRRFKIRCRRYVDSDLYFFEVKLKGSRGRTIKRRMVTTTPATARTPWMKQPRTSCGAAWRTPTARRSPSISAPSSQCATSD